MATPAHLLSSREASDVDSAILLAIPQGSSSFKSDSNWQADIVLPNAGWLDCTRTETVPTLQFDCAITAGAGAAWARLANWAHSLINRIEIQIGGQALPQTLDYNQFVVSQLNLSADNEMLTGPGRIGLGYGTTAQRETAAGVVTRYSLPLIHVPFLAGCIPLHRMPEVLIRIHLETPARCVESNVAAASVVTLSNVRLRCKLLNSPTMDSRFAAAGHRWSSVGYEVHHQLLPANASNVSLALPSRKFHSLLAAVMIGREEVDVSGHGLAEPRRFGKMETFHQLADRSLQCDLSGKRYPAYPIRGAVEQYAHLTELVPQVRRSAWVDASYAGSRNVIGMMFASHHDSVSGMSSKDQAGSLVFDLEKTQHARSVLASTFLLHDLFMRVSPQGHFDFSS